MVSPYRAVRYIWLRKWHFVKDTALRKTLSFLPVFFFKKTVNAGYDISSSPSLQTKLSVKPIKKINFRCQIFFRCIEFFFYEPFLWQMLDLYVLIIEFFKLVEIFYIINWNSNKYSNKSKLNYRNVQVGYFYHLKNILLKYTIQMEKFGFENYSST